MSSWPPVPTLGEKVLYNRFQGGVENRLTEADIENFVPLPEKFLKPDTDKAVDVAMQSYLHRLANKYPQALFDADGPEERGAFDVFRTTARAKGNMGDFEAKAEEELARAMLKKRMVQGAFGKKAASEFVQMVKNKGLKPGVMWSTQGRGVAAEFLQTESAKMIGPNNIERVVGKELERSNSGFSSKDLLAAIRADAKNQEGPWQKLGFYPSDIEKEITHPPKVPKGPRDCDSRTLWEYYNKASKEHFYVGHPRTWYDGY